jgi:hypothetical protein
LNLTFYGFFSTTASKFDIAMLIVLLSSVREVIVLLLARRVGLFLYSGRSRVTALVVSFHEAPGRT